MPTSPKLASVILAAGESTRMGTDKALLALPGVSHAANTFLCAAIQSLTAVSSTVVVVAGKNASVLAPIVQAQGAVLAINPEPERGQMSSLQVGLKEVLSRACDGVFVTHVDRPAAGDATIAQLKATLFAGEGAGKWAAIPEFQGKHGHPILLRRDMAEVMLQATPQASARNILHDHESRIQYVPVDDAAVVGNINTLEDYDRFAKARARPESSPMTGRAAEFVNSILRIKPRLAAFDCDGTLWSADAGESFFAWELARGGFIPDSVRRAIRARHKDYKAGKVDETVMCGEMVAMHVGMADAVLQQAAEEFVPGISSSIFPEMLALVQRLHQAGCAVWAVSSSNQWVIRAAMKEFGVPPERILATEVAVENGIITDRLVRVPSGPGKPKALADVANGPVDAAFGNSRWDTEMLAMATRGFAVNPNPDLRATARERGWTIYVPEGVKPKL